MDRTVINIEFDTKDVIESVIENLDFAFKTRPQSDGIMYKVTLKVEALGHEQERYSDGSRQCVNNQEQALHEVSGHTRKICPKAGITSIRKLDTGDILPFHTGVEQFLQGSQYKAVWRLNLNLVKL